MLQEEGSFRGDGAGGEAGRDAGAGSGAGVVVVGTGTRGGLCSSPRHRVCENIYNSIYTGEGGLKGCLMTWREGILPAGLYAAGGHTTTRFRHAPTGMSWEDTEVRLTK